MSPVQRWTLPNGLTCLYKKSSAVPLAAGTLLMRTGSTFEPFAKAGLASLSTDIALQGTHKRPARRLAEEIETTGAALGAHATEDYTELGFSAPVAVLPKILDIAQDVLTHAAFPEQEIKKERAHTLAALKSRKDSLFNVTYDAMSAAQFGEEHPYGRPIDGTAKSVEKLKRQDLHRWYEHHFRPDQAVFSMVGPFSAKQAREYTTRYFQSWKSRESPLSILDHRWKIADKGQRIQIQARFEQAYVMIGVPAPSVLDPDYAPLKVLNTVLGGGMSSRLFLHLREEMGLAYEVSSFFPTRLAPSQWIFYLGTPPEKLKVAREELERMLERIQQQGPTAAEIAQAIAMIKGGYLMEHQSRRKQAWYAGWWCYLGRQPDYGQEFLRQVESVTPAQAKALARRLLAQPRVVVQVLPKK